MWLWITIICAFGFAFLGIKIGFFETFAACFNTQVAIYTSLFLTPVALTMAPQAAEIPFGLAITYLAVAIVTFLVLYAICFFLITGQFSVPFPKVFDVIFAGGLGFFMGLLVVSFLVVLLSYTAVPGFTDLAGSNDLNPNINYLSWWCDGLHRWMGSRQVEMERPTLEVLDYLRDLATVQAESSADGTGGDPNQTP